MDNNSHCESCGSTAYEDVNLGDQGYTACCNERVCDGRGRRRRFGTEVDHMFACCWAVADRMFAAEGRTAPDGSCRLP